MEKARMIEPKRKGLIVPWLMIALALITIILVVYAYFWIESTRWYSNPGNTSTAVLVLGAIIAMPLLLIGVFFVGRNTKFNDRMDEIALSMNFKEISLLDKSLVPPVNGQGYSIPDGPIAELASVEKQDVRNEVRGEEKLEFACPICETIVSLDDSICPHCGSEFEEQKVEEVIGETEVAMLEEIPEPSELEVEDEKKERTAKVKIGMVMHCSQCGKILVGGKFCKHCASRAA